MHRSIAIFANIQRRRRCFSTGICCPRFVICTIPGASNNFFIVENLILIFFLQHSDEKPFKCNLCEKSFKLKRALAVHMAKHGSTKTYKCPFCGRTFNSSTNFYTHRKSIHPEQWQEMRTREMETQRKKRIAAGVEEGEIAVAAEAHTNYVLTTESGEEITIINLKESEGDEINVPVSILDENGSIISTNTIVTRYPAGQSSV